MKVQKLIQQDTPFCTLELTEPEYRKLLAIAGGLTANEARNFMKRNGIEEASGVDFNYELYMALYSIDPKNGY